MRKFTATRNILWVMHKHATTAQWLTFWPSFLVRYVFVVVVMSLLRGHMKSAQSTLAGIATFWTMKGHPDTPALPDALMQTTRKPSESSAIGKLGIDADH